METLTYFSYSGVQLVSDIHRAKRRVDGLMGQLEALDPNCNMVDRQEAHNEQEELWDLLCQIGNHLDEAYGMLPTDLDDRVESAKRSIRIGRSK